MSILTARRGSAARPLAAELDIPEVAGSAGGGRLGDGTFSITPPAGVEWFAWSVGWGAPAVVTPPSNWTLVGNFDDGDQRHSMWRCTGSPGSTWTVATLEDSDLPTVVRVVGYDRAIVAIDSDNVVDGPSPAMTATGPCLVVRIGSSFNGSNTDAPYPTSATLSRSQSRQWSAAYGFGGVVAVAHANQESAGAVASATWTFAGTPDWASHTVLLYSSGGDSPPEPGEGLVWSDEFDLANGVGYDTDEWIAAHWPSGRVNDELQAYTPRLDNLVHNGSYMRIIAKDETYNGGLNDDEQLVTGDYTSGRLMSKKAFLYGRIEARVKVPAGQGFWSAFWLYGDDEGAIEWPAQGEIDIMEILNAATTLYADVHGVTDTATNWNWQGSETGTFYDDFHVYSVDWSPTELVFKVDDVEFHTVTKSALAGNQIWPFDRRASITLNLAVGGSWPGSPNGGTPFPSEMQVDYVRVYDSTVSVLIE